MTTDQVNVIVDNAPPTVSITESWDIWDTARGSVHSNVIPVGSIHLTVECGDQPDRTYDYNANTNTFDFKWDRRCGDGNLAPSGEYTVVLEACDIYNNCDEARGKVEIPFGTLQAVPPTATPMPTIENTQVVQQWYTNPTAVPSTTPTPQAQQNLPVLPLTGNGESRDGNLPTGNNQPLLPLAAAALGTSVLLAASSRREEETANAPAAAESTYVEAASLSSIAGVVKETFTGIWEDAIRISAADPRRVTTTHTGSIDMVEYNRKLAGWVIASEQAYKEIAKEKEEKRQAAIQWLADNKARTDEAARVAKEQEKAAAIAAQKAAALDAKLARMEEQTSYNNVVIPNQYSISSKVDNKPVADDGDDPNIIYVPFTENQMDALNYWTIVNKAAIKATWAVLGFGVGTICTGNPVVGLGVAVLSAILIPFGDAEINKVQNEFEYASENSQHVKVWREGLVISVDGGSGEPVKTGFLSFFYTEVLVGILTLGKFP